MSQPKALRIIIPTEIIHIYSYFSLQAILIFYLIKQLSFTDTDAYIFAAEFSALSYLMPLVGGWIADRFLGNRVTILLGLLSLLVGYAFLALAHQTLLFGLSFIIIGNGLFKSSISSFLGEFYSFQDTRRDAGFTLAYIGINIGSLLAISSSGYIQTYLGWQACFVIPFIILLLGISIFGYGFKYFDAKGLPPNQRLLKKHIVIPAIIALLIFAMVYMSMQNTAFGDMVLYGLGIFFICYFIKITLKLSTKERYPLFALLLLFIIATFYKTMFFETFFAINVFTDRLIDRHFYGYELPTTVFLSLGSFFTIILGPLFVYIFQKRNLNLSAPVKFSLSVLIVGIGMQLLASWLMNSNSLLPAVSIVIFRFIFAISELFILPTGLAVITQYAPRGESGLMIGAWYVTAAFGAKLAGILAKFSHVPKTLTEVGQIKIIYHAAFQYYALLNFIVFAVCLLAIPFINKLLAKEYS